ncbi:MAG: UDP-N-acetylmuramoyl-tripeptide--D-alanyl-D-alanine ligase [Bacteroidota bacterium]
MIDTITLYSYFQEHPLVCTDSRRISPGSLFFALRGDRFDGHQYAAAALAAGAAYAIIDDASYQLNDRYLLVGDVLSSLQDLARHHRRQFSIPVLAITGSNGKTTTKELISRVLDQHYATHATAGNFNNHIGVPLTLLAMSLDTEVAVIEMGANHQGEIAALSAIAEPTHGLITNIGKAHLEGFGGLEGVKRGKSELYRFLAKNSGVAFVDLDAAFLEGLSQDVQWRIFYRNSSAPHPANAHYESKLLQTKPFLRVAYPSWQGQLRVIDTQLVGAYNYHNLMSAIAIGRYFKVPDAKIVAAIASYRPTNNRSQVLQRGNNTYLLDAYNANPTSMAEALRNLAEWEAPRKVAILGDMLELGEYTAEEHRKIVMQARQIVGEDLLLVGPQFAAVAGSKTPCFDRVEELREWLAERTYEDAVFLLKGSRGMHLERLLAASEEPPPF